MSRVCAHCGEVYEGEGRLVCPNCGADVDFTWAEDPPEHEFGRDEEEVYRESPREDQEAAALLLGMFDEEEAYQETLRKEGLAETRKGCAGTLLLAGLPVLWALLQRMRDGVPG